MQQLRLFEVFLIEFILYLLVWLWNDYVATILCLTFGCITFFILLISYLVEWISPSKVPTWYYRVMLASVLAPLAAALVYVGLMDGRLDWLEGF